MAVALLRRDPGVMTGIRRGLVWAVVAALVLMLVATLILDAAA